MNVCSCHSSIELANKCVGHSFAVVMSAASVFQTVDRMVTETRSQFQSALRRTSVYLGMDSTEDNTTIQSVSFQYLKRRLGAHFQLFIYGVLLTFLFMIALISKSHEKMANHHLLLEEPASAVRDPLSAPNITSHFVLPINGTALNGIQRHPERGAGILYIMFSLSIWMCMLSIIKRLRMNTAIMANGGTTSRDIRQLAQFVYANRATMPGLANRLRMAMLQRDFTGDDYEMLQLLDSDEVNRLSGVINRGASEALISSFPTRKISPADARHQELLGENASQCNVCLAPYELNDELRTLPCSHCFHKDCIDPWLRTNAICPVCKCSVQSRVNASLRQEGIADDMV